MDAVDAGEDDAHGAQDGSMVAGAIAQFPDLLHRCCLKPDDVEFWDSLQAGIGRLESGLDARAQLRFGYAVDSIMVGHGLPAWSTVRQRHLPH